MPYLPFAWEQLQTLVEELPAGSGRIPQDKLPTNVNKSHQYSSIDASMHATLPFINLCISYSLLI